MKNFANLADLADMCPTMSIPVFIFSFLLPVPDPKQIIPDPGENYKSNRIRIHNHNTAYINMFYVSRLSGLISKSV